MQSQHSSRSIERTQFAIVQAVLQVPVVQLLLQHHENYSQQLSGCRTDGLARAFLPLLLLIELHQWRLGAIHH